MTLFLLFVCVVLILAPWLGSRMDRGQKEQTRLGQVTGDLHLFLTNIYKYSYSIMLTRTVSSVSFSYIYDLLLIEHLDFERFQIKQKRQQKKVVCVALANRIKD